MKVYRPTKTTCYSVMKKRVYHFKMTKMGLSFKKSKLCGQKLFKTKKTKMLSPFTGLYLRRWREEWDFVFAQLICMLCKFVLDIHIIKRLTGDYYHYFMIISYWGINFLYLFQLTMCNVIVCNVGLVSIQSLQSNRFNELLGWKPTSFIHIFCYANTECVKTTHDNITVPCCVSQEKWSISMSVWLKTTI